MLVSTIITNGMLLADIANTSFYTAPESLFAVQLAWEQIYSFLCANNDDYFVTPIYITMGTDQAVSTDANRTFTSLIDTTNVNTFADGFYRLRMIQYQGSGGGMGYNTVSKMSIEGFGNTANVPGYRFEGKYIAIYDPSSYPKYCLWYYPRPITLATSDDIIYPYNMIPEIMAYQVAAEIRRKQKADITAWTNRINELYSTMSQQMSRDDSHGEPIKNQFANGFAPYI
jgi:hypothetical protein